MGDAETSTPVRKFWRVLAKLAGLAMAILIPLHSTMIQVVSRWWAADEYPLSAKLEYKEPRRYGVSIQNTTANKTLEDVKAYVSAGSDTLSIFANRNGEELQRLTASGGSTMSTAGITLYPADRLTIEVSSPGLSNLTAFPKIDFRAKGIRAGDASEIESQIDQWKSKRRLLSAWCTEIMLAMVALFCLGAVFMIWRLESALRRAQADAESLRTYLSRGTAGSPRRES